MTSALLGKAGKKLFEKHLEQYAPADPKYEFYVDERGEQKRRKRELPPGLSVRDAKILKAVKNRASRLDRGFNLCGFRFGYTFFIGLVPVVGDVTNIGLNYFLVVRKAKQADLPDWLVRRMLFNNALSGAISFIPFVGDVMLAIVKANSRNAALLEEFLRVRGEEFIAIRAAGGDPDKMQKDAAKAARKKRGKNKKGKEAAAPPGRPEEIAPGVTKGDAAQVKPGSGRVEGEKIGTNGLASASATSTPGSIGVGSRTSSSRSVGRKGFGFTWSKKHGPPEGRPNLPADRDSRFFEDIEA